MCYFPLCWHISVVYTQPETKEACMCLSRYHYFLSSQTILAYFAIALWVHLGPIPLLVLLPADWSTKEKRALAATHPPKSTPMKLRVNIVAHTMVTRDVTANFKCDSINEKPTPWKSLILRNALHLFAIRCDSVKVDKRFIVIDTTAILGYPGMHGVKKFNS